MQTEERVHIDALASALNPVYEYATEYIQDSWDGTLKQTRLDAVLKEYASSGWRLHTAFVNEAGKNTLVIGGFGLNATMDTTILIFERCIKRAGE